MPNAAARNLFRRAPTVREINLAFLALQPALAKGVDEPAFIRRLQGKLDAAALQVSLPRDRLLTKQMVADLFHVSHRNVERWAHDGKLRAIRHGRRVVRFLESEVMAALTVGESPSAPTTRTPR